ncbi:unnamed protein product [Arabidopsis thaliana]|nr:unnamed protein product [Arabidopsis thaliana]
MMISSSSVLDEEYEYTDDGFHYETRQNSLSRLSICTNSFHEDDEDHPSELGNFFSTLSLESFNDDVGAEADVEISDDGGESDSDKDSSGFYSLPTITSRRRRKLTVSGGLETSKESETKVDGSKCNIVSQRRVLREKSKRGNQYGHWFNGVERDSDGGGELTVLTKVRGGKKKSMKMGFEEVKACRDLGFELDVPGRVSGSNRETSSGGNSPIANWRISSPGDDPKEVKARLKMWAQAVALASASR